MGDTALALAASARNREDASTCSARDVLRSLGLPTHSFCPRSLAHGLQTAVFTAALYTAAVSNALRCPKTMLQQVRGHGCHQDCLTIHLFHTEVLLLHSSQDVSLCATAAANPDPVSCLGTSTRQLLPLL